MCGFTHPLDHILSGDSCQVELGTKVCLSHHTLNMVPDLKEVLLDCHTILNKLGQRLKFNFCFSDNLWISFSTWDNGGGSLGLSQELTGVGLMCSLCQEVGTSWTKISDITYWKYTISILILLLNNLSLPVVPALVCCKRKILKLQQQMKVSWHDTSSQMRGTPRTRIFPSLVNYLI